MNWPVFFKRTASATVFALIMLAGLLVRHPMAIIFLALLIQFLCLKEYLQIMEKIFPNIKFSTPLFFVTQILAVFFLLSLVFMQTITLVILFIIPISLFLSLVLIKKTKLTEVLVLLSGLLYVVIPMASLIILKEQHFIYPLALIVMIWINDTMAYITGSFFGKTPFSSISPKKTWEGTIGGAVLTLVAAIIYAFFTPYKEIGLPIWIGFAIIATVAGTAGDLLESKLKRMAGVKDSGNIMPGHGGALDRFDSILAALPFAIAFIVFIAG